MYRDTSSVDYAPRELTHACSMHQSYVVISIALLQVCGRRGGVYRRLSVFLSHAELLCGDV